ncbi:HOASN domain-containing protein, partial [Pseudomonas aeruginosa]
LLLCCTSSSYMNFLPLPTLSEPARYASFLLAAPLQPCSSPAQITLALWSILAVTAKGLGVDASALAQYPALL